jgi:hypothetical protein
MNLEMFDNIIIGELDAYIAIQIVIHVLVEDFAATTAPASSRGPLG